ncbi:MAG: hypothetical protein H6747_07880 [Deltaproteobacteria bacterium]|nr:hypothetical protein [Deltaproteobacteria bacterium]
MNSRRKVFAATLQSLLLLPIAGLGGCGGANLFPDPPAASARCRVGLSQTSLLVTEWSAAEKANLETQLQRGAVGVAFSGCALRLLPSCQLGGVYRWMRTTPARESLQIEREAELYAKLPLAAVTLQAELKRSGSLQVETHVVGQARLDGMRGEDVPNSAACAEVTHVVTAVSVGAHILQAGSKGAIEASADVPRVGEAGGKVSREVRVVSRSGVPEACAGATSEAPPADCAAPIQVFLEPVPGRAPPSPPPGTVQVDVVAADADHRWDVIQDDQARCTTPCVRHVDPSRPLVLRSRDDRPDKLLVPHLPADAGPLQIRARGLQRGPFVTGLTFTALGGMGLVAGVALAGAGCSQDDEPGLCRAGQITMAATTPVLVGAIWLMVSSRATYGVRPLFAAGPGGTRVGLSGAF